MSYPTKPTEDYAWAEGGGALVSEPTGERSSGFPVGYPLTAAQYNWLQRMAGRWLEFAEDATDWLKVRADLVDDLSLTVDYIDQPLMSGDSYHEISQDYVGTNAGLSRYIVDVLHARLHALTDAIRPESILDIIDIQDSLGQSAGGILSMLQARVETLRAQGSSGVTVHDSAGARGFIHALNTPRAWAVVDGDAGNVFKVNRGGLFGSVAREGSELDGYYDITLSSAVPDVNDVAIFVSNTKASTIVINAFMPGTTTVRVRCHDLSGSKTNTDFSIAIYY
jgi:hypothetical protein